MIKKTVYNIIEIANTHGGSKEYVFDLLNEFEGFKSGFGVKFQPFKYNEIATKKYEWYPVYQELFFSPTDWEDIINQTIKTKDVWLDLSSEYSCEILTSNLDKVTGVKFQSSMLYSRTLISILSKIDCSNLICIVNIAGLSIKDIEENIRLIEEQLNFKKIVLQIGFQNYPTDFEDSGIAKIQSLATKFKYDLSFTDHLEPSLEDSKWLPIIASMLGTSIIEKHVKHSSLETKYDYFSSMNVGQYSAYIESQKKYFSQLKQDFLNKNEINYLKKSIMVPFASKKLTKGQLISSDDLNYKRSDLLGINIHEISDLQNGFHILNTSKKEGEPFYKQDFKKATIAVIVACRLKSTRLPEKAIREVRKGVSSIELCQENCLKIDNVNHVILATSNNKQDAELANYVKEGVVFHTGDAEDVIERYLTIIEQLKIDVVIRLTGDCPYPSNEVIQSLLKSHFETGADYTQANKATIGSDAQIINTAALKKVRQLFPITDYSEYMNGYIIYNPNYFKLNYIDLPKELVRCYRLTLDYPEDLEMFKRVEEGLLGIEGYSYLDVINYLDDNPQVAEINNKMGLIYKVDPDLYERIKQATTYKE